LPVPSPLTIPGVQVRTQFEPAPVLPGATGVLGVVGVADRGPVEPTPIGSLGEFLDTFGQGSRYTMPEVRTGLANGVFEVFVARIEPGRGKKAALTLQDEDGEAVAVLEARAEGKWGEAIAVTVTPVRTTAGATKYINLDVTIDGTPVESHQNLVMDEESPSYFFDVINERSRVLVAYDPLFEKSLPSTIGTTAFDAGDARPAFASLKAGATDVILAIAKRAGAAGNQIAVQVTEGRAAKSFAGAADAPSIEVRAREAGSAGTQIRAAVVPAGAGAVSVSITPASGPVRTIGPAATVAELEAASAGDPDVEVVSEGDVLPATAASTPLERRVDIAVFTEGRDTRHYTDLASDAEIAGISDTGVAFSVIGAATALPDHDQGVPLTGGRAKGPALELTGASSDLPLLELVPAPNVSAQLSASVAQAIAAPDPTPVVNLALFADGELVESFANLTMNPDDPGYLPEVLAGSSAFVRAHDLFVRSRTTSFPKGFSRPVALKGSQSPTVDDYADALTRLEEAEEVDLVVASTANQLTDADAIAVHQAVVAHCTKMADIARNRIGIGSVSAAESASVSSILQHADDVRSDHFILTAPSHMEGPVAGLLGRQDYFESPTFKTIASLNGGSPGRYTDAQLTQLINGNVCVINQRRRLGTIVMKGLLTSGRQINVQRTANKTVRDVKAIADKYIGLLNNEGGRNALKQQITALLVQMERDGAIVKSTDGKDPAFTVDVYSTQADFANGIVRVDLAIRPVRAIDFVYATILVRN
jgi:hypothetical protein